MWLKFEIKIIIISNNHTPRVQTKEREFFFAKLEHTGTLTISL